MADDSTWIMWAIGGICGAGAGVAAFLNWRITSAHDAADEAHDKAKDNELATANLRAHVSENYTTKAETQNVRVETQHVLERLHGRIDDVVKSINDMPQTIITLLNQGGGK